MSGGTVCVLALNGRKQTVKCNPNTTILQILEEVCKKQQLQCNEYDLKHHNKILDTTQTFRFSGLPNNAQLELVPVVKIRAESEVVLAANLENGTRLTGKFLPSNTLLEVLKGLCPEVLEHELSPVVIYTRREIYGEELGSVTLKTLGLTGGRAMIRILHRDPEDLKMQANVSKTIPSKPTEEKPYVRKYQPVEENEQQNSVVNEVNENDKKPILKRDNVDLIKLAREKRKSTDSSNNSVGERKKSLTEKQDFRQLKKKNACSCKSHNKNDDNCLKDCKGTCNEKMEVEEDFVFLGDRNAMLFSQETAEAIPHQDLPDEFFDLTIDDAKKLLRDVRKQRQLMENSPLLTSNLRNLEDSKKQLRQINKYKKAIIRIQFPDRVVLQGTFNPYDTIKDVIEFIRQYLEDQSLKFYVFTTPPKCILDENKQLLEEGFVPGALIHFGTFEEENYKKSYLKSELKNKFTSNSMASLAAAQIRKANTRKCGIENEDDFNYNINEDQRNVVNDGASTSAGITHDQNESKPRVQQTPPENVPKWFKPL